MTVEPDRTLEIRKHPHADLVKNPQEVQVGWVVDGAFLGFVSCKNETTLERLLAEFRELYGSFSVVDRRKQND
jgi:hypothetical protein